MKFDLKISLLLLVLAFITAQTTQANDSILLPVRIVKNEKKEIYTLAQVCEHSRQVNPNKKAAMVIVKTHNCDPGTQVCLKTATLVADVGNRFVHDNFTVFHTRFMNQGSILPNSGEESIRTEWNKPGSDPEFVIIDVAACQVIFREYAKSVYEKGMFWTTGDGKLDFEKNYRAMRELLLSSPKVAALLDNQYILGNEGQIQAELKRIAELRSTYPQPTLNEVLVEIVEQDKQCGVNTRPCH